MLAFGAVFFGAAFLGAVFFGADFLGALFVAPGSFVVRYAVLTHCERPPYDTWV